MIIRSIARYRILLLLLVGLVGLVGLLSGCFDDGGCKTTTTNLLKIKFKNDKNKAEKVQIKKIALKGTDGIFHRNDKTDSVTLPLDPNVASISINFTFETQVHELTLGYTTTPRLISSECGVELSFTNLKIKTHDFPSAIVVATSLDKQTKSNIVIRR